MGERNGKKDARKLEYAWLGCSFPIDTISLIIFEERRISAGALLITPILLRRSTCRCYTVPRLADTCRCGNR